MDASVTETYLGEWKNDKRTGFGISERSDGLRYEGEWFNNRKYGYGVTTFRDGSKEEGKYKNNVLITSQKKRHLFLIRSAKFRERIEAAVNAAQRASKIALQKADIAISRTATARGKAELADIAAEHAREDSELAQQTARQFAPDFRQPGLERLKNRDIPKYVPPPQNTVPGKSILHKAATVDQSGVTPMKSATSTVESATTTTTMLTTTTNATPASVTASSVMQSIRRASMKPPSQLASMQNQMPNQVPPGPLANQVPMNQLNAQTTLSANPYQQYSQNLPQNPLPTSQYPNSIPNQYQPNQYVQQNQFAQSSPYQAQYQPANPPQVDQYSGYQQQQQQQPIGPHGFQNLQAYPSQQQVTWLAVFPSPLRRLALASSLLVSSLFRFARARASLSAIITPRRDVATFIAFVDLRKVRTLASAPRQRRCLSLFFSRC